jgi:hypothetical protein
MQTTTTSQTPRLTGARRGLAWLAAIVATSAAVAVGAVLAVVFAASVVVIASMAVVLLALAGVALRARRGAAVSGDGSVIEARQVGGHSWVAYGWDERAH